LPQRTAAGRLVADFEPDIISEWTSAALAAAAVAARACRQ
jgi:hypothetical protein